MVQCSANCVFQDAIAGGISALKRLRWAQATAVVFYRFGAKMSRASHNTDESAKLDLATSALKEAFEQAGRAADLLRDIDIDNLSDHELLLLQDAYVQSLVAGFIESKVEKCLQAPLGNIRRVTGKASDVMRRGCANARASKSAARIERLRKSGST